MGWLMWALEGRNGLSNLWAFPFHWHVQSRHQRLVPKKRESKTIITHLALNISLTFLPRWSRRIRNKLGGGECAGAEPWQDTPLTQCISCLKNTANTFFSYQVCLKLRVLSGLCFPSRLHKSCVKGQLCFAVSEMDVCVCLCVFGVGGC